MGVSPEPLPLWAIFDSDLERPDKPRALSRLCSVADPIVPLTAKQAIAFGDCDRPRRRRRVLLSRARSVVA